jgi:transcriptional regulator with XRE-family HTH domain
MARERGADLELAEAILRAKREQADLTQAGIARRLGTSQKTISRVLQVKKGRSRDESPEDMAARLHVSPIWVRDVLRILDRLDHEVAVKRAADRGPWDRHMLDLVRAARRLNRELELKADQAHMGWRPPTEHEWSLAVETEVLGECLTEHLKDTEMARVLAQWKEKGRRFSAKAWALVGHLDKQYPATETIGLTPQFVHSVYNEVTLRASGSPGTSDRYETVEQGGILWLWRGAYGIARAGNKDDLERSKRLHREAILKGQGDARVGQLVNLANEVRRLGEQVREQLLILALKREFPGRCQACPEVR